jgi:beta-phosphoglucomutase-like phosphatase (HAD superfamily)
MIQGMKAVIFDMDGVIIDSEPLHYRLETQFFKEVGINLAEGEYESFTGTSGGDMFTRLKKRFGLNQSVEELLAEGRRRYMETLKKEGIPIISGIPELIARLSEAGMKLAVASSAPHEQIDLVMNTPHTPEDSDGSLARFFSVRVSGDDVDRGKPDPSVFLKAAELLGTLPEDCWVIEDSENGVKAARAAGMSCIGYQDPGSVFQDLSRANVTIREIKEAAPLILG